MVVESQGDFFLMATTLNPNDFAKAIVAETTEAEAKHLTNCRSCQAGMVNWRMENPQATKAEAETQHRAVWETCETCVAEYNAWSDAAAENARYTHLDGHAFNGDDLLWQRGGVK